MQARDGFAPVDGTSLWFRVTGRGPAVVFLHGRGLDHSMWARQVEAIAGRYTTVAYDLRGFGRSPQGENEYAHADDLALLLDHLGLDRVALVGASLGGGAAINFAVQHPRRPWALVPVDSSLGGFAWSPEARDRMERLRSRNRGRALDPPAAARLGDIEAPTLAVVGERDAPDFHAIAESLERGVRGAQRVVIPGVGHMPSLEDADAFNALLAEFLDRHRPRD